MIPRARVRDTLFATRRSRYTGNGARLLLVDGGGVDPRVTMGGRLASASPTYTAAGSHGYRGAVLCGGDDDPETGAGVAPNAHFVAASFESITPAHSIGPFQASIVERFGRVDVTVHAYSAVEDHVLAHEGRADLVKVGENGGPLASTHIAAAGHDPGIVRFPASCPSVIAVGVCEDDGTPSTYSGTDPEARKPELLVPNRAYLSRLHDGELATMSGTSAAVNVVGGLAALWCECIRESGLEPTPWLVRAALLGSSEPSRVPAHRIASVHPALAEPGLASFFDVHDEGSVTLEVRAKRTGTIRVCAVARHAGELEPRWLPRPTHVRVKASESSHTTESDGDGWVLHELDVVEGQRVRVEITQSGPRASALGIAVFGAATSSVEKRPAPARARRSRVVVGLSASHDASACVIRDGKLESAIQLERLTRKKHDGVPFLHSREAVDYCLATLGLRPNEVDAFAFNLQSVIPAYVGLSQPTADATFDLFDPFGERAIFVSHHLAHAFSAFFASPFDAAGVFVADGSGGSTIDADDLLLRGPEFEAYLARPLTTRPMLHVQSTYRFDRNGYTMVDRELAPSFNTRTGSASLGELYASVSQYVFGDWQEGGKLMGLGPYGDAEKEGPSFLVTDADGRLQFRADWKNRHRRALGPRNPYEERHLAARVQKDLETALVNRAKRVVELTGSRKIAYTGGLALNSAANERMRREAGIEEMFILPASNDAGIAIGAAAAAEHLLTGGTARAPVTNDFLGHAYGNEDCRHALRGFDSVVSWKKMDLADIVERLAAGQVIGWFEGGSEFGPRALGHRSMLADPRSKQMWDHINRNIKFREDFRPFAPAVPVERVHEYFDLNGHSPYMLRVVPVKPAMRERLGAVTHVDGSARVQTVDRAVLPRFHELLTRYGDRTGVPILVNTSLNVRGEPVVETPTQAIELLLATHLDALVLGDYLVVPRAAPKSLPLSARPVVPPKAHLAARADAQGQRSVLVADARGRQEVVLEPWLYRLLADADGEKTLAELFNHHLPPRMAHEDAVQQLDALARLRLVLFAEPRAREPAADAPAPTRGEGWQGIAHIAEPVDREPNAATGTWRTRPVEETYQRAWALRSKTGVTRLSHVSGFDVVGLPVAVATRPDVGDLQISATQGKGLSWIDARVSALMEAIERASASAPRLLRRATAEALRREGATIFDAEALRAPPAAGVLEWIDALNLRNGESVLLPAADVLFPYTAPEGVVRPVSPSTTGLAAGNTRLEATVQAMCEVIERDASSRYCAGARVPLLDLTSVDTAVERDLLARFADAGIRVAVADLRSLAPIPVFFAFGWSDDHVGAPIPCAGQGAALSAPDALRRALLELAQSRVVSIQGSREDLARHCSDWKDDADGKAEWERQRHACEEHGLSRLDGSTTTSRPAAPRTVEEHARAILDRLAHAGLHDVLVTDLTSARIGMPVVHVTIPGLVDTIVDEKRRVRVA